MLIAAVPAHAFCILQMLQSQRPYLVVPAVPRDRVERRAAVTVLKIVHEWKVEGSLFSARRKEAEAKDLYDSNQVPVSWLFGGYVQYVCACCLTLLHPSI